MFRICGRDDIVRELQKIVRVCKDQTKNIVEVYDIGDISADSVAVYFDMELCSMNLQDYIQGDYNIDILRWRLPDEPNTLFGLIGIMEQVMSGIEFIHGQGIVHRNLCPQNGKVVLNNWLTFLVLYAAKDNIWKIADFGVMSGQTLHSLTAFVEKSDRTCYIAPELLLDPTKANGKADIWSLGCICFELCTGNKRFSCEKAILEYFSNRGDNEDLLLLLSSVCPVAKPKLNRILKAAMEIDADNRPFIDSLIRKFTRFRKSIEKSMDGSQQHEAETRVPPSSPPSTTIPQDEVSNHVFEPRRNSINSDSWSIASRSSNLSNNHW